jgi:hypothetical protein
MFISIRNLSLVQKYFFRHHLLAVKHPMRLIIALTSGWIILIYHFSQKVLNNISLVSEGKRKSRRR